MTKKDSASEDVSLQSLDFFIPLPNSVDIESGINFPIIVYGDGRKDGLSFKDSEGIDKWFNTRIMFHQIPSTKDAQDIEAAFATFQSLVSSESDSSDIEPKKLVRESKVTVVQVSCIGEFKKIDEELLTRLFDESIDNIRHYLKAYNIVTHHDIELVTRQNTSFGVPYAVSEIDSQGQYKVPHKVVESGIFLTQPLERINGPEVFIDEDKLNTIAYASETYLNNLLDQFSNIRREAHLALNRGNTIVAGILLGMSAEIFLDELLLILLWEEGCLPEIARGILKDDTTDTTYKRIESSLYTDRLGGDWDFSTKGGAVREWRNRILLLRNKIAHAGYEPTQAEMKAGIDALNKLVGFVCDRLCANLKKYPISLQLVVGSDGIAKRGLAQQFQDFTEKLVRPTNPQRTFGNWKFEIERLNGNQPFLGSYKKAKLHLLVHANGQEMWMLVDEDKRLAKRIPDQDIEGFSNHVVLVEHVKKIKKNRKGMSTLIEVRDFKPKFKKNNLENWLPVYTISDHKGISRWEVSYLPPELEAQN